MARAGPFRIRPARPEEARALTRLALASKAVWGYAEALREQFLAELTITPEYIRDNPVFVADDGGRDPLAIGALAPINGRIADLDLMFVAPGRLRHGVGRAMFAHLCAVARTHGYRALKITSDPHALGFYQRMGATHVGEEESASISGRILPVLAYPL
jgi:GNAT superfamily N-acetyltransferase